MMVLGLGYYISCGKPRPVTGHFPEALGPKVSGAISRRPLSSRFQGNLLVHLALLKYLRDLSFFIRKEEQKKKGVISHY